MMKDIVLNILSNWINILDIASLDNALTSTTLRVLYLSLGSTNIVDTNERLSCNVSGDEWNKYQSKTEPLHNFFNWLLIRGFGLKSLRVLFDVNRYEIVLRNVTYLHGSLNQHTVSVIVWSRLHLLDVRLLIRASCDISPILELLLSSCNSIRNIELSTQNDSRTGMMIPPRNNV